MINNRQLPDFSIALKSVNAFPKDHLLVHGNAGIAAQYRNPLHQFDIAYFIDDLLNFVEDVGTIISPAFTYSFTRNEDFYPEFTPGLVGQFAEAIRLNANTKRSHHPIFSMSVYGKNSASILQSSSSTCFGRESAFESLTKFSGKILCLGCQMESITFLHYIEELANVPYRFHKSFSGQVVTTELSKYVETDYFVRDYKFNTKFNLSKLRQLLTSKGIIKFGVFGRFNIMLIDAVDMLDLTLKQIKSDPFFLVEDN